MAVLHLDSDRLDRLSAFKHLLLLALLQQRHETDHKARLGQCTSIGFLRKPASARPPVKFGLVVAAEPPLHKGAIEIRYFEGRAWGPPWFLGELLAVQLPG